MTPARPESFGEDWMSDWSAWVLDNGLPDLPETVEVGWSVPIARWVGEQVGAVLHVQWNWSDDHDDDELNSEVEVLARSESGWQYPSGSGGIGWLDPPLVRPEPVRGGHIFLFGEHGYTESIIEPGTLWAAVYGS